MSDSGDRICDRALGRRGFLGLTGLVAFRVSQLIAGPAGQASESRSSLSSAPITLGGVWKSSPTGTVLSVLSRMREVSLAGVRLVSDRQPARIYVDDHPSGWPAIWFHSDRPNTAWVIVNIGPRDWCKLSYQFGHELGHVLCNSWQANSKPGPPCQWLEESIVEAFSIRGLGRLADSWQRDPPFAGDSAFSGAIRDYRQNLIKGYGGAGGPTSDAEIALWFRRSRKALESSALSGIESPFIVRIVSEMESDIVCVEDLGALNRWPGRSRIPLNDYLRLWEKSCAELQVSARLPVLIRKLLAIG
jgi:hypothetical protein